MEPISKVIGRIHRESDDPRQCRVSRGRILGRRDVSDYVNEWSESSLLDQRA